MAKIFYSPLAKVELSRYPNGELKVRIQEKEIQETVAVVQSFSHPPNKHIVEFCLLVDACRRLGAKKIVGVIPWLGYCIQDKIFRQGEPLSLQVVANIIKASGTDSLITIDLHNPVSVNFFNLPVNHISALPKLVNQVLKDEKIDLLVAPDLGSKKETAQIAKRVKQPLLVINKERDKNTGKIKILGSSGKLIGKNALILDDFISTGGTLLHATEFLRKKGMQKIIVAATHHLHLPGVQAKLDKSGIDKIYITDTVRSRGSCSTKLKLFSVAPLLVKALRREV